MAPIVGLRHGRLTLFQQNPREDDTTQGPVVLRADWHAHLVPHGAAILQSAGIRAHDAIILVLGNDATSVACLLGAMQLQCICVLVGSARVGLLPLVQRHTGISTIVTVQDATQSVRVQIRPCADASPMQDPATKAKTNTKSTSWLDDAELRRDGCVGLLTSGSIGEPKVVAHTWERMRLQGHCTQEHLFATRPARIICATPISHMYSINAVFTLLTSRHHAQSELCFVASTSALQTLLADSSTGRDVDGKLSILYGTPATYAGLLAAAASPSSPSQMHVDIAFCAGSKLNRELFDQVQEQCGLQVMQNYGSTETGDITAWGLHGKSFASEIAIMERNNQTDIAKVAPSASALHVGSVWPGVQVQVDASGEVLISTPWQSLGYVTHRLLLRNHDAPHQSGDRGHVHVDANGVTEVALEGRIRELLLVDDGEHRVVLAPERVERVVCSHSAVTDALALMQDIADESPLVLRVRVVTTHPDTISASDLETWLAMQLGIPRAAVHIDILEYLPCSPAGKLMYR